MMEERLLEERKPGHGIIDGSPIKMIIVVQSDSISRSMKKRVK
jgi:hypothetical protein